MATIKKAQTGAKIKKPVAKPKEDKYKGLGGEIGRPIFSDKEQRERRKKLGLPTSKAEEKAYYDKMAKEGAKNGKTIKKAQSGDTIKKKYPTEERFTTKNYDLKKTTYPGGGSKTETTFKSGAKFNIPSMKKKKAKSGASLGMKSVKSGFDNNPGVTRADIITAAKGKAKSGAKMKNGGTKKAALGALLPLAMKAAPMVAGMLGGGGKGKSGGMGGMLGGLLGGKNGKNVKKAKSGGSMKKCRYGCK